MLVTDDTGGSEASKEYHTHIHTHMYVCMYVCMYVVGERSEPLSRVFNDQPRDIYIYMVVSVRTYISNTQWAFEYFVIEIQVLRSGRLSSLNNRSSGISNVQSSYVNLRQCSCVRADC